MTTAIPSYCQRCQWSQSRTQPPSNRICHHPITITTEDWQLRSVTSSRGPCIFYTPRAVTY